MLLVPLISQVAATMTFPFSTSADVLLYHNLRARKAG